MLNVAFRSREVEKILAGLDSFGGTDPLGLFPLLLKEAATVLAPKLSTVFRLLFRQGRFPLSWRIANITPIPKGAPSPCASNYRPISITPVLSKVFEKVISARLSMSFEIQGVIPRCQFAYQKGLGTCDALLSITTGKIGPKHRPTL